jgi:ribonuclease HII
MRICGLDEAGRGALAGPLVASAAILNIHCPVSNLKDSKKLNKRQREEIYKKIIKSRAVIETETISARQINNRGVGWANKEIFRKLIKKIEADKYIVDGNLKLGKIKQKTDRVKSVVRADGTRKCVMAASIAAKVTRDEYMVKLHHQHPVYGWKTNMGYGTRFHIQAIKQNGTVRHHRGVFVTTALKKASADF